MYGCMDVCVLYVLCCMCYVMSDMYHASMSCHSEFLRLKRVPIDPLPDKDIIVVTLESCSTLLTSLRDLALSDRDVMEKGQKAYVSWIRAYKEHQCSFIFVFNQLPFASVAKGMGLLFVSHSIHVV